MKKIRIMIVPVVLALLFQACSSPVYVQKDNGANFSRYKTYMWVTTKKSETDGTKRAMEFADISVHNAVNSELKSMGWREVSSNPDVLISYDVLVEKTTEQQSDPVYSQPFTRVFYNPYRRHWATIYYPSQFLGYQVYEQPVKEGTVTITMIDASTDKTVWQGWTTETLNYSRITSDEITRSVKNIFRKFDVAMR